MFLPKTSKCCFTRLSDTLYLGAFLIIGTLHFVKWILLGPIQVVLIFHHFLIVSLVKFTHLSLQHMKRYVLRQLKRIGCDPCRFPQNVLLLMERLCEGSVTNRDTCSRKSLRAAGRICRSQEVFASRQGSMSSNLGARFFWSQDTGQTDRFNVEVLFINVLMCCEMFWYVLYMLDDSALMAFLYPQSTMPPCAVSSRDQWISKATFGRLGFLLNQNLPSFTLLGLIEVRLTMVYQLNCGLGIGMFLLV